MMMNFTILILVICDLCVVTTECAEKEVNQSHSKTPRPEKKTMRMLVDLEKGKKVQTDTGSSSARERLSGITEMEFEPESRKGGSSKRHVTMWTNEENRALLQLGFNSFKSKGAKFINEFDWGLICHRWNAVQNEKPLHLLKSQMNGLLNLMRVEGKKFDVHYRGGIPWPQEFSDELLKIYFATDQGDKSKHGERMLAEWREKKLIDYEQVPAAYLLSRAEAMLSNSMKFDLDNPQGRTTMLNYQDKVDWKPEHDEYFRKLLIKHPRNEKNRIQNIYKDAMKKYPGARFLGKHRVFQRAKKVSKQAAEVQKTTALDEGSVPDVTHSKYYSFLDRLDQPLMVQRPHHNDEWIASTSSHPGSSNDHPNLELRLKPYDSREKSLDTNLKLGHSPHGSGDN